ncbi:metal-sulfur cluster biosynthetic enzyme [Prauserella sp. PE36]|uniref:Iron-sulfur cluster assembly protein n=1 Tax=Prauserella endophytica TaxID=1592324 RepID=A0ABY2SA23_9PSEU|nr:MULTISPECIES: iron-sulfur cluster assembly protein [Prauserella]PXY23096.1 metal-sulfur cluster biosynthetic enzyme [Prauserella coralliicola]RBM17146.1 metal-sulfur cluster biosynthetic enzyme [Prauserella sp. PE36]TKG72513.1 iron-sulfur cluster assembly protein [Prauserella endophytica]
MTRTVRSVEAEVLAALATVIDPELDEPVTELGFVRSVTIDDRGVEVHLRLPTSFCAPNFAYLMVADAYDALAAVPEAGRVRVLLDDHHDSDKINQGTAAGLGYVGTFGVEAEDSLDELRRTFRRKAHLAAMERCCRSLLASGAWTIEELPLLELFDLPVNPLKSALLRRREAIGLPNHPHARVLVDHDGTPIATTDVALRLRLAATTRVSIEGNAHFCRGLLATRYADADQAAPVVTNSRSHA